MVGPPLLPWILAAAVAAGPAAPAPPLPPGPYRLWLNATWAVPPPTPVTGLALDLQLPPGVLVAANPETDRVFEDALIAPQGRPILASARFQRARGQLDLALVNLRRKAWEGPFVAVDLRVLPGFRVTAADLQASANVALRGVAAIDLAGTTSVDLTAATTITLRLEPR
ncbi:hypothetical protein [Mesoterricola sediminis]|uniref:Uncharacterized protein n=1 Tax=Mesoterricola sediminis TaxID=2927980 RepID=A0AA48GXJ4_9BACT|nr:hypothetical protein [Mesoterricola sediminis]BDU77470.1 hypothetical protein METESE_24280 [Mesoterricola sediminis]